MTRLRADYALLFVALIWGAAFVAQKYANDSMGPLSFVGARFLLSWAALAPLALFERNRAAARPLGKSDLALAAAIGLCLFAGTSLQQVALVTTSATNAGFLTAVYVVMVPFVLWMITGARPRRVIVLAGVMSVAGAWLLTEQGQFH